MMQQRWGALEAAVAEAQHEKAEALGAAAKADADLASLSAAYNQLEAHAFSLEEAAASAKREAEEAGSGGGLTEAQIEALVAERLAAALAAERQQQQQQHHGAAGGSSGGGGDVEALVEAARAAAAAEADEAMGDLLVCLGQEEAKVAALSERLAALGEDVDALLAGVVVDEEDDEEAEG